MGVTKHGFKMGVEKGYEVNLVFEASWKHNWSWKMIKWWEKLWKDRDKIVIYMVSTMIPWTYSIKGIILI